MLIGELRVGGWVILGTGFVSFAALCLFCVPQRAHWIEQDVLSRTTQALKEGHIAIPPEGVRIRGRDLVLTAPRGEALVSDATRELVATIRGVRRVQVNALPTDRPSAQ